MNASEIDITRLLETDMFEFSHSRAEGGQNAGPETWQAAVDHAKNDRPPLLETDEQKEAFRDFVESSGGWGAEEIAAWNDDELNALLLQWIAGDVREAPAMLDGYTLYEKPDGGGWWYDHESTPEMENGPYDSRSEAYQEAAQEQAGRPHALITADSLDDVDWLEYEAMSHAGQVSSNLFKGDDGKVYFSLSN